MKFQIKNRWSGNVQYECELAAEVAGLSYSLQLGWAVKKAVAENANLRAADLSDANLRAANLSAADLSDADLRAANLSAADLSDANLRAADLSAANLSAADLRPIRDDIWSILSSAPTEVQALRDALADGRVDGSTYSGECACLVGTLAHARGTNEYGIPGLAPNSSRPAERFFMNIRKGDKPETNQSSAIALAWVDEWLGNVRAAFAVAA